MKPPITPTTKVGELLDGWPELESVLLEMSPAFEKLKNPILRRTVAKVATLERAAALAGLPVRQLVARLRQEAGLPAASESAGDGTAAAVLTEIPRWAEEAVVAWNLDADAMLAQGRHPLGELLTRGPSLGDGEVGRISSSFPPEPLRDAVAGRGLRLAIVRRGERFETFVGRD